MKSKKGKSEAVTEAVQAAAETVEQTDKPRRNVATQLHVLYKDKETGEKNLTGFDFKADLDKWLQSTNVEVLTVIRGVEKKIKPQNKIYFA